MLTDTGYQVSVQLGQVSTRSQWRVVSAILVMLCRDAAMVQNTVADHRATDVRLHINACAETIRYRLGNVLLRYQDDGETDEIL